MEIVALEISHKNFPIEIREQLPNNESQLISLMQALHFSVEEVVIISTCNRWSIYAYAENINQLLSFFKRFSNLVDKFVKFPTSELAVKHLFSTAAGLESQVLGEHEIQGQIRNAAALAREVGSIGPVLDELMREAIRVGKLVRSSTAIGTRNTSFASTTLSLIKKHASDISGRNAMILGTGRLSRTLSRVLRKNNFDKVYIASHSMLRAQELVGQTAAIPVLIDQIESVLDDVDILIGSTHREVTVWDGVLLKDGVCPKDFISKYINKPRLFIDLGMPRNFNPILKKFNNIWLYDLDDIKMRTVQAQMERIQHLPEVKELIENETEEYLNLLTHRRMAPLYGGYWGHLNDAKAESLEWLKPKLNHVGEKEWKLIERGSHRLIRGISKIVFENLRKVVEENQSSQELISLLGTVLDIKGEQYDNINDSTVWAEDFNSTALNRNMK